MNFRDNHLTQKQQRFIKEYLVDLNGTQAAIRAGYSKNCAKEIGYENLTKPHIAQSIQAEMNQRSERCQIDQDYVLEKLVRLASVDLGDVISWDKDGNVEVKPSSEIDRDVRYAIQELNQHVSPKGRKSLKVKLHDKLKVLEDLAKHLGMFDKTVNLNVKRIDELILVCDLRAERGRNMNLVKKVQIREPLMLGDDSGGAGSE